jgi:hypothetical protein
MQYALKGLFERQGFHLSIGCRPFAFDLAIDSQKAAYHDPDIHINAARYAGPIQATHRHLVVMVDNDFDSSPGKVAIRDKISDDLIQSGWQEDAFAVIVIDPELEVWLWQESPHVDEALAFDPGRFDAPSLRAWLEDQKLWRPGEEKPHDPKKAFIQTLRRSSRPLSSTIFEKLAHNVSLRRCTDPAFNALCESLRRWFPA